MSLTWLISYVGVALVYSAVAILGLAGLGRLTSLRWIRRALPTAFAILFFVVLTQHPFPDPASLECPVRFTEPQLVPFHVAHHAALRWPQTGSIVEWLLRQHVLAALMNLVLCAVIGATLARHQMHMTTAVLLGFGLSLAIESTQLTGVWGFYRCAYRQFDVDDLILNTSGVAAGFAMARQLRRLRE